MRKILKYSSITILVFVVTGCSSPFGGIFNTGGTNDPRKLISIAHDRMYRSGRVIGARNVLRRAIEQSIKKNDYYALSTSYNMMAYTYIAQHASHKKAKIEPKVAESYYRKAEVVAKKHNHECELIHTYVGLSLANKIESSDGKACEYLTKAEGLVNTIRGRITDNTKVCEHGEKDVKSAEKRVGELKNYLACNN